MRQFKFRVWEVSEQKMIDVDCIPNKIHPSNLKIMQWTGYVDATGKEIYEGDMVQYDNSYCAIRWLEGKYVYDYNIEFMSAITCYPIDGLFVNVCRVVGNVFQWSEQQKNYNNSDNMPKRRKVKK